MLKRLLAIELMNAAQAFEVSEDRFKSSATIEKLYAQYRMVVPFIEEDEIMYTHMQKSTEFIKSYKY